MFASFPPILRLFRQFCGVRSKSASITESLYLVLQFCVGNANSTSFTTPILRQLRCFCAVCTNYASFNGILRRLPQFFVGLKWVGYVDFASFALILQRLRRFILHMFAPLLHRCCIYCASVALILRCLCQFSVN